MGEAAGKVITTEGNTTGGNIKWLYAAFDITSNLVTATKGNIKAIATIGSALIITKIADNILGGKNATTNSAIPIAISKISGIDVDSVFWELDPENNAIKYRDKTKPAVGVCSSNWGHQNMSSDAILNDIKSQGGGNWSLLQSGANGGGAYQFSAGWHVSISCVASTEPAPYSSIPVTTVADKIYDNAKTDDNTSMLAVNEAVSNLILTGQLDVLLNSHIKSS